MRASAASSFADGRLAGFISMDDGLPGNYVDDIFRDDAGFMWIATSGGGLCRYDGYDYVVLSTNSRVRIKNNFVRCVAEDGFHRLWIASEGGLDVLDLNTFEMLDLSRTPLGDFQYSMCSFLSVDALGCVWVKFGTTLLHVGFSPDGEMLPAGTFSDPRLSHQNFVFEDVDSDGTVWAAMAGGIYKIAPSSDGGITSSRILDGLSLREDAYVSDFLLKENEVWISTSDGLYRYSLNSLAWRHYTYDPGDPSSLTQNFISGLATTDDRRLIAVSLKGFNVYDPLSDSFERVNAEQGTEGRSLLRTDFINCVKVYDGVVWLGTETAGVARLSPRKLSVENLSHDPSDAFSIAPNPVNALYRTPDGTLWVGNVEGGLNYGDGVRFRHVTKESHGISHNSVSAICRDPQGRIWTGTWGGGVDILSPTPSVKVLKSLVSEGDLDNPLSYVGSIEPDPINNLMWIGTNAGIYYYDLSNDEIHPALPDGTFGCVGSCTDRSGRLWMGSQEGVFVFDLHSRDPFKADCAFAVQNFKYKLDEPESHTVEKIYAVCEASDSSVWLGSYGNGIYKAAVRDDGSLVFRNFSSADGLVNDCVKCILEDSSGDLWISTENGLSRFSPGTLSFSSYSVSDGLASSQFYINAALKDPSGKLLFGHPGGLSVINPALTVSDSPSAHPCFTRISVAGKVIFGPYPGEVILHERDRGVTFEFSSLTYDRSGATRYACRLEGQDDEWIELPAGSHSVNYTSMRHGRYVLRVMALGNDREPIGECELPVRVNAYFYHTGLFYLLVAAILGAAVVTYQKRKLRQLTCQREELQATVEERTREIGEQKKLIEEKMEELARQNKVLARQNEELAGQRMLLPQESRAGLSAPRNDAFLAKAVGTLRDLYKDPALDVPTFCAAMGMSKTQLGKRLQESAGQSVGEFIRSYRLSVAREMLLNNRESKIMNISEIAYESGFNDPKYFTRCFTREFGVSPSEFQKN